MDFLNGRRSRQPESDSPLSRRTLLGVGAGGIALLAAEQTGKLFAKPAASFADVGTLLKADAPGAGRLSPGDVVAAGRFRYHVVGEHDGDFQLRTAGGAKLKVIIDGGILYPEQFGATGASASEHTAMQTALDYAATRAPLHISRVHRLAMTHGASALQVRSNTKIVFAADARLELLPHDLIEYAVLALYDVENVEITDAVIDGRRDLNRAVRGEWGHGISIRGGCANIKLVRPITRNCWGDGIYIGQRQGKSPRAITVVAPKAIHCRRQGMSIISVDGCHVQDAEWVETGGTAPSAGLDIEPNNDSCILKNIRIDNPRTRANEGSGIKIYLERLGKRTEPIDILINNHVSSGSFKNKGYEGLSIARCGREGDRPTGKIVYANGHIENAGTAGIFIENWDSSGPEILIAKPTILNPAISSNAAARGNTGIGLFNDKSSDCRTIGNVTVKNMSILRTDARSKLRFYVFTQNLKVPDSVAKVHIVDPVRLEGALTGVNFIDGPVDWQDPQGVSRKSYSSDVLLSGSNYATISDNRGATKALEWTLDPKIPVGFPPIAIKAVGHPITVLAPATRGGKSREFMTVPIGALARFVRSEDGGTLTWKRSTG